MLLVRYMSLKWGIESVKTGWFKILRPLDTNDPYEMMGACYGRVRDDVRQKMLEDMYSKWKYACEHPNPKLGVPLWEDVARRIENCEVWFRKIIMDRETQQRLSRILCFMDPSNLTNNADQLMWGHYAEGGRGIRIWFDSDKIKSPHRQFFRVEYRDERPAKNLAELRSYEINEEWIEFLKQVILSKSKAWEYEHEWRLCISSKADSAEVMEKDGLEFINIPAQAITRIDFGSKGFDEDTIRIVEELSDMPELAHIKFKVATFSDLNYMYEYVDYDEWKHLRRAFA